MSKLPFYFPDNELNLRIGKLLVLLNILTNETKKKSVFNLERIAQFDFLTKHPILLNRILDEKSKKTLSLNDLDKYSIEAMFPNRNQLFDFTKMKLLLNILISYDFIKVIISSNSEIYYLINEKGMYHANNFEEEYFQRLKKILLQMKPLINMSHSQINKIIQTYL